MQDGSDLFSCAFFFIWLGIFVLIGRLSQQDEQGGWMTLAGVCPFLPLPPRIGNRFSTQVPMGEGKCRDGGVEASCLASPFSVEKGKQSQLPFLGVPFGCAEMAHTPRKPLAKRLMCRILVYSRPEPDHLREPSTASQKNICYLLTCILG